MMDDKTKGLIDRLLELERIAQQATPGPWCVESLGEKGDGSNVIGVAFGPDDQNAKRPLSGWLEPFDKDGNEIDYYRDEEVAVCEHRERNAGPNAAYIMTFDPPTVLVMIAALRAQADEIERIQQKAVVVMEMYEAELARIRSAEGCDVEGALDAYMDAPNKGLPYDSLVQQRMSAALAVGCAPLRAKVEKMEAILREIAEDTHDRVSPGLKRTALSALKAADAKRREQEKE